MDERASYIYVPHEVKDSLIYDLTTAVVNKQKKIDELLKQAIELNDKIADLTGRNKQLEEDCKGLVRELKEARGDEF